MQKARDYAALCAKACEAIKSIPKNNNPVTVFITCSLSPSKCPNFPLANISLGHN
jgi:hypothetical protein